MTTLDLITREDLQKFKAELFAELRQLNITTAAATPAKKWMKSTEVRDAGYFSWDFAKSADQWNASLYQDWQPHVLQTRGH